MNVFRRRKDFKTFNTIIKFYSITRRSHYDVLNLRKNCTDKEIKEAYIQLSKEYHPDKNKDAKAQDKFVQIVEAYNVLSKPSSRAHYDSITDIATGSSAYVYRTHVPYKDARVDLNFVPADDMIFGLVGTDFQYISSLRNNPQYSYYYGASTKSQSPKDSAKGYYGVNGIKKLPNYSVIMICVGFVFIGVILQIYVIRNMYIAQRKEALEKSKHLAQELDRVRAVAKDNGNELQTRLLLDKIVTAASPTVATASLGQALATEKKDVSETLLAEFDLSDKQREEFFYDAYEPNKLKHEMKVLHDVVEKILSYFR